MSTTTSTLNDLIQTLKDAQEGFRAAAEAVKSPDLQTLFNEYSLQRSKFAGELQAIVRNLGNDEPETGGSVSGALHRGWIDLKGALTKQDDHAILAECERGEDSAVAAYEEAIGDSALPGYVLDTLQEQYTEVRAAHDRVRDLRDSRATA